MVVAIKGSQPESPLFVEVEEKDGEVRLKYNNHTFAVCRTKDGQHVIQIIDVDSRADPLKTFGIQALCWQRCR